MRFSEPQGTGLGGRIALPCKEHHKQHCTPGRQDRGPVVTERPGGSQNNDVKSKPS